MMPEFLLSGIAMSSMKRIEMLRDGVLAQVVWQYLSWLYTKLSIRTLPSGEC